MFIVPSNTEVNQTYQVDPQQPSYAWRDDDDRALNKNYGSIVGSSSKRNHPVSVNKPNNLNLGIKDIEGSQANSFFARSHFVDVSLCLSRKEGSLEITW